MKEELDILIEKLLSFGEDKPELDFWRDIFDTLAPDEQKALLDNLKSELSRLEAA